jgi:regulator of nonsense transcripts 2
MSVENDMNTLNLSKYLSEIAASVTEARFKITELPDIVVITSWIHQRYSEFAGLLLEDFKKSYPIKKSDMVCRAAVVSVITWLA